jgi:hypothetical protein
LRVSVGGLVSQQCGARHKPLDCAQASDIFGFEDFACFAAMAGDVDTAARTTAIAILTTNLMEGPRKYRPKRN